MDLISNENRVAVNANQDQEMPGPSTPPQLQLQRQVPDVNVQEQNVGPAASKSTRKKKVRFVTTPLSEVSHSLLNKKIPKKRRKRRSLGGKKVTKVVKKDTFPVFDPENVQNIPELAAVTNQQDVIVNRIDSSSIMSILSPTTSAPNPNTGKDGVPAKKRKMKNKEVDVDVDVGANVVDITFAPDDTVLPSASSALQELKEALSILQSPTDMGSSFGTEPGNVPGQFKLDAIKKPKLGRGRPKKAIASTIKTRGSKFRNVSTPSPLRGSELSNASFAGSLGPSRQVEANNTHIDNIELLNIDTDKQNSGSAAPNNLINPTQNSGSAAPNNLINPEQNSTVIEIADNNDPVLPHSSEAPSPGVKEQVDVFNFRYTTWDGFLQAGYNFEFVPKVDFFKHAPFADVWNEWGKINGSLFEIPNPFITNCSKPVYWMARVIYFAGYNALVQLECFGIEPKYLAWISYFNNIPKPLGYSDKNGILLYPPHEVTCIYPNFMKKGSEVAKLSQAIVLEKHVTGIRTILEKCRKYSMFQAVEVVDIANPAKMKLATVVGAVGDRIHVMYISDTTNTESKEADQAANDLLWFNVNSDHLHPTGWSKSVDADCHGAKFKSYSELSQSCFPVYPIEVQLEKGQHLEVRHPTKLGTITAAYISKVLKHGYFVVDIRSSSAEARCVTRCIFHITSPYIFPCDFTQENITKNMITSTMLAPPFGEPQDLFTWDEYLSRLNLKAAPLHLLPRRPAHKFKPGMKLEAVLFTNPSVLSSATILSTTEHLLLIQYDDFNRDKIWIDSESPDIYPIGYSELVGQEFVGVITSPNLGVMVDLQLQKSKRVSTSASL